MVSLKSAQKYAARQQYWRESLSNAESGYHAPLLGLPVIASSFEYICRGNESSIANNKGQYRTVK
jgi:hypothetical protein